ncbi:MAG: DUF1343 domain-containing protein [Bacteroidetes bacterium]|nr:MAG: DUF1343 domain-containing protein [Bacteroidota bacterium]
MQKIFIPFSILLLFISRFSFFQPRIPNETFFSELPKGKDSVIVGAARFDQYLPLLKGKSVAIFANQTTVVGGKHLVDLLKEKGVSIKKIFSPEHGFRGTADAGEKVNSSIDAGTGIQIISLYGEHKMPSAEELSDVDIMIFDIQDVGVRFYTYISSLEYFLASAIENNKPVILLDRPNPNADYVDGPVLNKKFKSFVGMQSIPVVYGMTLGEYAKMLLGEKWIDDGIMQKNDWPMGLKKKFQLTVVPCSNYTHATKYILPVKPSPNLPDIQSVYAYPTTCFFEGTVLSEGRGTEEPFRLFGHPSLPNTLKSFTPKSVEGAKNPKLLNETCYGWEISGSPDEVKKKVGGKIQLKWIIDAYKLFPDKDKFFLANGYFNKLAGNDELMQQIKSGQSETSIRKSWQNDLQNFKLIRKKYLIYP